LLLLLLLLLPLLLWRRRRRRRLFCWSCCNHGRLRALLKHPRLTFCSGGGCAQALSEASLDTLLGGLLAEALAGKHPATAIEGGV
jgi:hypothetical protein